MSIKLNKDSVSYKAYQTMSKEYSDKGVERPFNSEYERPAMISLIGDVKGKKVLDAGCSAGWYSNWLFNHGADVIGVDFSENMIELTKEKLGNNGRFVLADLNNPLDFVDNDSLDLIISSLTLHYIKNWDNIMKEFYKKLKIGGELIFSIHHPTMEYIIFDKNSYFDKEKIIDIWDMPNEKVKVEFYTRPLESIVKPLVNNGFVITDLDEPMPTDRFKELRPEAYKRLLKRPQFLFIKAEKI